MRIPSDTDSENRSIAQVSSLMEAVPPKLYGGTERIVAYLTDELVKLGHDVTLFASGDSITKAKLEACVPSALRLDTSSRDYLTPHILMLERIARTAEQFDILHLHIDCLGYSFEAPKIARGRGALPGQAHAIEQSVVQSSPWR